MKEKRVVRTLSVRQVQSPRCSRATAGDVALENDLPSWDNPVIKYDMFLGSGTLGSGTLGSRTLFLGSRTIFLGSRTQLSQVSQTPICRVC
jgi:hypothetical protein